MDALALLSPAASLKALFEPKSVAVVGAGRRRGKIGAEVLHNLVSSGFTGELVAVNPSAERIEGIPSHETLTAIPGDVDLAIICVPAAAVPAVFDDAIAKGVKGIVVITAGFAETGEPGRQAEAELLARARRAGIRMVGPNCMGLLNTNAAVRLNATFSPAFPPAGRVAMSTQSGALGLAILDYAKRLNIGFSTFVSVGNKADVSGNDLLQYWETDPDTDVILLYLESFGNPRKFSQIARRISRTKPIVAVKAGRSAAGARAASSHTGALASSDVVVDALFRQTGVIRTRTIEELFDVTALLSQQPVPRGRRVAILTNAGGPAILAADACQAAGLELPALSESLRASLASFLPAAASTTNPVDMIASATAADYERALSVLVQADEIDSVIVVFVPPMMVTGEDVAKAIKRVVLTEKHREKPVLAVFMSSLNGPQLLAPIPAFAFPESAAAALARVTDYAEWRQRPLDSAPDLTGIDEAGVGSIIKEVLARGGGWAMPDEATRLLRALGIASVAGVEARTEADAVSAAEGLGYPVVLKAFGPKIVHKSDIGGVRLRLENEAAIRRAFSELMHCVPGVAGVLVQPMVDRGVEMLIGFVEDRSFGPVVACGIGGTLTEIIADTSFRLAPLTCQDAKDMVGDLRAVGVLRGYRGGIVADERALADAVLRLSAASVTFPQLRELEINPLRVMEHGVLALDARVRIAD